MIGFLASCQKNLPNNGIPSNLQINLSKLIHKNDTIAQSVNFYEVFIGSEDRGTWQSNSIVPSFFRDSQNVSIVPIVRFNNFSTLLYRADFLTNYNKKVNLIPGQTIPITPVFSYRSNVEVILEESFEQIINFTNASSENTGNFSTKSMRIDVSPLQADTTQFAVSDFTVGFNPLKRNLIEFDYKMTDGVMTVLLEYTEGTTTRRIQNDYFLTPNQNFTRVYWDMQAQLVNNNITSGRIIYLLTPQIGKQNAQAWIDNIKIIQF
jgi:hypothetical protein